MRVRLSSSATTPIAKPTGASSIGWSRTLWRATTIGRRRTQERRRTRRAPCSHANPLADIPRVWPERLRRTDAIPSIAHHERTAGSSSRAKRPCCLNLDGRLVAKARPIHSLLTTNRAPCDAYVVGVACMKKFAVTADALIALLGVTGCAGIGKGKGKAPPPLPPPPVMTKG